MNKTVKSNAGNTTTKSKAQAQLERYKKHLQALQKDPNYANFEEKRKTLADFYNFKIGELTAQISREETNSNSIKNIQFKGRVVHTHSSG